MISAELDCNSVSVAIPLNSDTGFQDFLTMRNSRDTKTTQGDEDNTTRVYCIIPRYFIPDVMCYTYTLSVITCLLYLQNKYFLY